MTIPLRTHTGRLLFPFAPSLDAIAIEDIAHALANICRFGGHTHRFYSVAQHSVSVSLACDESVALWGLLHDASEAYLCDVPRPIKTTDEFLIYRSTEAALQQLIFEAFGLMGEMPTAVTAADDRLLAAEFRDLMPARDGDLWRAQAGAWPVIRPMLPEQAKAAFLARFHDLAVGVQV